MNTDEKISLIKRNTEEILTENELKNLLNTKPNPVVYIGTAITRSPHIAYFLWANKIADFIKAGFSAKILLADLHGALDNTPWEGLEKRYQYYARLIPLLFSSLGVKKGISFVKGSEFQLSKKYMHDLLKLATFVSVHDSTKAASEVVKMGDNPKMAGILYPLMQSLDEEYLGVDVQYGGIDQRRIFVLAAENLPKIGYKKRVHVMTPLVPGLVGKKMSSSVEASKIDLLDAEDVVDRKIRNAECEEGNPDNGVLAFLKNVIFPLKEDAKHSLTIERPPKFGGSVSYKNYSLFEKDFRSKKVHPLDVKNTLAKEINALLKPMRDDKSLIKLHKEAFQ